MDDVSEGASRRDVLKATGATAMGIASFLAAANGLSETAGAVTAPRLVHIPTSITMTVNGVSLGAVHAIGGGHVSAVVVNSVDAKGVVQRNRQGSRGASVSVTRYFDSSKTLRTWFAGLAPTDGTTNRGADKRNVVLTLRGARTSTICTLTLSNAWPSVWSGPTWQVPLTKSVPLTESVHLVAESATFTLA
jgi:hypothetical protein